MLRALALAIPGPFGAVLNVISTGVLGVLSGGVSLVQAAADNIHFRRKQKDPVA